MEGEKPTKTKPKSEKKNKNKFKTGTTIVNELQNKMYGTHGANDVLFDLKKPFNIIAVDPGHEVLIDSVRLHKTDSGLQQLPAKGSNRREAKFQFLQKGKKSTFRLTNKQWAHDTLRLLARKKTLELHKKLELQPSVDILAEATSKTTDLQDYLRHATARIETAQAFIQLMRLKCTSRWKFETYQREQRALQKLSTDLLGGLSPLETLVVWGNGSFGPTSRGHDSAPNKKLYQFLSRSMPIVLGSEYKSTQLSSCCHLQATKLRTKTYTGRGTAVRCPCGKMLGRDENAAHNIMYIFQYQHDHGGEMPAAFR
jgi:hypothetical protein